MSHGVAAVRPRRQHRQAYRQGISARALASTLTVEIVHIQRVLLRAGLRIGRLLAGPHIHGLRLHRGLHIHVRHDDDDAARTRGARARRGARLGGGRDAGVRVGAVGGQVGRRRGLIVMVSGVDAGVEWRHCSTAQQQQQQARGSIHASCSPLKTHLITAEHCSASVRLVQCSA